MSKKYVKLIRDVKDFPKKGVVFKDITPFLADYQALKECVDDLCKPYLGKKVDKVVGIEARGFIFGSLMARQLGCGFVPVRKKGKLPSKTLTQDYKLEYGRGSLQIHQDALNKLDKVVIIDDLLATGGTVKATVSLVERLGSCILGISFVIKLGFLNGEKKLLGYSTNALMNVE